MRHIFTLMQKYLVLFFALIIVGGCQTLNPTIESNVTSFNQLPANWKGKSIQIKAYKKQNPKDLEWLSYRGKLESKLKKLGFNVVTKNSDYIGFFGFAIDSGRTVTSTYSIPQWGQTGVSGSSTYGSLNTFGNTGTYSGTTTYTPTYRVTGYSQGTRRDTTYTRSMSFEIINKKSGNQLVKTQLSSQGSCGTYSEVVDEFLELALTNFPNVPTGNRSIGGKFNC
ncbi:MAG: hypothetical protein ACJZ9G_02875 [Rhodospirillales bacterium]